MHTARTLDTHLARIKAISNVRLNGDTACAEVAARNLANRQPAFWCSASYSSAAANDFMAACNRIASIDGGRRLLESGSFVPFRKNVDDIRFLDALIPLNAPAVADLQAAYELLGTFRGKDELTKRDPSTRVSLDLPAAGDRRVVA